MRDNNKIYKILIVIIFVFLVPFCIYMAGKEDKNQEEIKRENLHLIKEFINYYRINDYNIKEEYNLNEAKSFIIVRNRNDDWTLDRAYNGKEMTKVWSKEDIEKYDLIVFAISSFEGKEYENATGNTKYLTSESVYLYYYNVKENSLFKKDYIKGEKLGEVEDYNHEISSNQIFDKIKNEYIK